MARETSAETEDWKAEAWTEAAEASAEAEESSAEGSNEDGGVPCTVGRPGELLAVVPSELLPQAATVVAVTASRAVAAAIRSGCSRWVRRVVRPPVFVTWALLSRVGSIAAGRLLAPARPRLQPIAGRRAVVSAVRVVVTPGRRCTHFP
ncbi:hypothetical protein GCM10010495_79460 [Kitasatospora herbaricolor]|nr:hypothetical protein GCM10010495_79460 [Kitasatospora herbaricolor]